MSIRLVRITAAASTVATLAFFGPTAGAQILNGGFEDPIPFNHWATTGYTAIVDSSFGITAPGPTHVGLAGTDNFNAAPNPVPAADLETFLGLAPGALDAVGNGTATEGSGFEQTFSAMAGDTVSFQWKFLTNEFAGDPTDDFAFFTVNNGTGASLTKLSDINDPGLAPTSPPLDVSYGFETPFATASFVIPLTGTYTLGFGVVDVTDFDVSSAIAVDLVGIRPAGGGPSVPEPGALALTPAACIAGFALRRRRSR